MTLVSNPLSSQLWSAPTLIDCLVRVSTHLHAAKKSTHCILHAGPGHTHNSSATEVVSRARGRIQQSSFMLPESRHVVSCIGSGDARQETLARSVGGHAWWQRLKLAMLAVTRNASLDRAHRPQNF